MRYLAIGEVMELHDLVAMESGGAVGVRDLGALQSALAQPEMAFGGEELYPGIAEKSAALCFFIVQNHPFIDGNKRTGHAAMELFLVINGFELEAPDDEQEDVILRLAAGDVTSEAFREWVRARLREKSPGGGGAG